MRTLLRTSGGVVAAVLVALAAPIPASAGGPTSVLLASPTRGVAAALYNDQPEYAKLMDLVGNTPTRDKDAPDLTGGPGSDAVNVTWLIHDVQVWRVDRVFVDDRSGGAWIETVLTLDGGDPFATGGVVHRGGAALVQLLTAMKLIGPDAAANQGVLREVAPAAGPRVVPAADREPAGVDWVWGLAGAAAGAMLVVALRPLVRRRRPN